MSNIKVINILPEHEAILGFLYPTYGFSDSLAVTSRFIAHREVKSKAEREALDWQYSDGVFISSTIFDEVWDTDKIKEECIKFSHSAFKNRKKTFQPSDDNFINDCINFIFSIPSIEEQSSVNELFDSFGSASFISKFIILTESIPYQQLTAALTTFISKISIDSASAYYKKKAILYRDRIDINLTKALDNYINAPKDFNGLNECKLFLDLATKL